jgi:SAM-dependent methyltransferase
MEAEARHHDYDDDFFNYIEHGSRQSAQIIVPMIAKLVCVHSVLDVGCGRGVWLKEWHDRGVSDILGIDGSYVDRAQLAIAPDKFVEQDISQPFALKRRFDLVQSLEVGEHISPACADNFVANLVSHGDIVLFSAAVPGQGGEFHINEQPNAYWRDKFAALGFRTFDWLRPRIYGINSIEPWYRYNTLLFARETAIIRAPGDLLQSEIPPYRPLPTLAPLFWRVRNALLAQLAPPTIHQLAVLKHKFVLMRLRRLGLHSFVERVSRYWLR